MTLFLRIRTIPHDDHRYDTVGDWTGDDPTSGDVLVSAMPDWRYEFLIGLHELIEKTLCNHRGISDAAVSDFDAQFTARDEPGDDPQAPYRREHFFATNIERLMAAELGVDWDEYDTAVNAL